MTQFTSKSVQTHWTWVFIRHEWRFVSKAQFWGLMKWLDCEWFEFFLHSEHKRQCQRKQDVKVKGELWWHSLKSSMFGMASYHTVCGMIIVHSIWFFWMHIVPGWRVTIVCIMQQSIVLNTVSHSAARLPFLIKGTEYQPQSLSWLILVRLSKVETFLCTKFD